MSNGVRILAKVSVVLGFGAAYYFLVPERYRCFAFAFPLLALVYPPKGHPLATPTLIGFLTAIATAIYVWRRQGPLSSADWGVIAVVAAGAFVATLLFDLASGGRASAPADRAVD